MKQLLITAILTLFLTACATPISLYKEYRKNGMSHSEAMELVNAEQCSEDRLNCSSIQILRTDENATTRTLKQ
jgi:hypothetical protein